MTSKAPCRKCVEKAIRFIECSRTTHVMWLDYYEQHGHEYAPRDAGDVAHQQECIVEYDYVLSLLRCLLPEGDPLRTAEPRMWRPRSWGDDGYGKHLPLCRPRVTVHTSG